MSQEILLSAEGLEKLKKELEFLKGPEREKVAENIREAKSHGDLRENAMYHEAKLNQTRLEARISEIERSLQFAKVVDRNEVDPDAAHLGSEVTLLDVQFQEEFTILLVGDFEADPTNDKISISSPMGSSLKGVVAGAEIEVRAPAGMRKYTVVTVKNP